VTCDPNDGLLTGQEIRDHLSLRCDLVSLSGCFTAAGGNAYTSSILSFGNAFLYAGAHSILASLWLADDRASALLMTRFHEDRAGAYADDRGEGPGAPMRKVRALQEAKRWLREWHDPSGRVPYRHPAYWAGFVLIGDPG
jgi:CHAT domain-containing protein